MRRSEFAVLILVEAEDDFRSFDHDRPSNQVRILHHQLDRLALGGRQRPLLEHGAAGAHEVEEPLGVDVFLEKRAVRRGLVDVDLLDVDLALVQETPGVLARGSGGFRVENRLGHQVIVK